jgi:anti-anti-sigma factor
VSDIAFERRERVLVARPAGEIDIASADGLEGAILSEARAAEDAGLVVDLSGVRFLDSAGIRLLFALHRAMTEHGRPMAIVVPDGARIAPVLSIVDISSVMWVATALDEAVERLFPAGAGDHLSPL